MGFPLSFSKSRRAKQPGKGRAARFRALEERALLSAVRVTALDFLTFEGSYSKTGVSDPDRFDWHEVGCGRPSGGHTAACWGSQESYQQDMLSMSAKYADAALAQSNATALAAEKTQNAALRDAALDGADSAYKVTVRNAWNNSYLSNLESGATAKTDDEALAAAANASLESAAATYRAAAFADYGAALDDLDMIDRIAAYQRERVDRGISVPNDAFADLDDPDFEYQVCFAAGTPVLMADGSTKPIETVRPGDLVLASDHLDPESEPVPARVVRFFDNGLKEVVRVRFEGGTEFVCTPGHRFYVAGQGWKHANELALGDACLSADGKRVAFEGRDAIAEPVGVFNLEVEGKHTYFVGRDVAVLVHNECPYCSMERPSSGDLVWITPGVTGFVREGKQKSCPYCTGFSMKPSEFIGRYVIREVCTSEEISDILAMGCVGIASFVCGKIFNDSSKPEPYWAMPIGRVDACLFLDYTEACKFYKQMQKEKKNPVLIMYLDKPEYIIHKYEITNKYNYYTPYNVILPVIDYDFRTLANVNVGDEKVPCWVYATDGWKNNPNQEVLFTPVYTKFEDPHFRRGLFIVIPHAGTSGLKLETNFDIPDFIPVDCLPQPFEIKEICK